jgi:membrane protein
MTSLADRADAAKSLVTRLRERAALFDLLMTVYEKGGRDGIGRLSAVVSYFAFFSIFPLLLVLVSVVGMLANGSWAEKIQESALASFPVIGKEIAGNGDGKLTGSSLTAIIAGLAALWSGTHAFDALEHSIHAVSHAATDRPIGFLKRRLRALALLGILGGGLIATTVLSGVVAAANLPGIGRPLGSLVTAIANILLLGVMFAVAIPGRDTWRRLAPGAILGGVGLTILHSVGSWFLQRFVAQAKDTYGTFAVIIGLLTWVKLIVTLVLWSAELNTVLADRATIAVDGQVIDGS